MTPSFCTCLQALNAKVVLPSDSSPVISPSPVDGLHLEAQAHKALGLAVADIAKNILG